MTGPRRKSPSIKTRRPVLVTGGAGFIGSNLADRLASDGHDVLVYDALARPGVEANLDWLKRRHPERIAATIADVRDADGLISAVRDSQAVFHLAAQVAVTTSLTAPYDDFDINVHGTVNLLEAVRKRGRPVPVLFASTNKVYGDLADLTLICRNDAYTPVDEAIRRHGIAESRPLEFCTPYGCSKGAADQYVLDYARSFGVPAAVLRMSCIYGARQMGTEDQGWVAHFLICALAGEPIRIYGDGRQVRDILDVTDAVDTYLAAWQRIDLAKGRAFNLGGGPGNAVSLVQLIDFIERVTDRPLAVTHADWRPGDQRYYVSDIRLVQHELGLRSPTPWQSGVATLTRWLADERGHRLNGSAKRHVAPKNAEAVP